MARDIANADYISRLKLAWDQAKEGANSLRDALVILQQQKLQLNDAGPVASVGKNSAHQSFRGREAGALTLVQIERIYTQLIQAYDAAILAVNCAFQAASVAIPADYDYDGDEIGGNIGAYQILVSQFQGDGNPQRGDITNLNLSYPPPFGRPPAPLQPEGVWSW